jgi:hypothetical protein
MWSLVEVAEAQALRSVILSYIRDHGTDRGIQRRAVSYGKKVACIEVQPGRLGGTCVNVGTCGFFPNETHYLTMCD